MKDNKELGASAADATDRATDAPHGADKSSPPSGSVSTGAAHTPGPWEMNPNGSIRQAGPNKHAFIRIVSPWIESAWHADDDDEVAANMRLIAAAPDLAEALRDAADMCAVYADFIRHHVTAEEIEVHPYLPGLEDVIVKARAALSRLNPGE